MIKKFLTFVLPFLLPTIAYIVWVYFRQEREEALAQGRRLPPWQDYPWAWLLTLGTILAAATVIWIGTVFDGAGTDTQYRPAHYEDGKLTPGEFVDEHKKAPQ